MINVIDFSYGMHSGYFQFQSPVSGILPVRSDNRQRFSEQRKEASKDFGNLFSSKDEDEKPPISYQNDQRFVLQPTPLSAAI